MSSSFARKNVQGHRCCQGKQPVSGWSRMDRSKAIQSRLRISRGRCLRADRVDPAIPCRTRVDGSQESLLSPDRNRVVSCQLEGTEGLAPDSAARSEEHTSELQSLMRIS